MQVLDERVWLSPSDVTAYLACAHLTSLSLRVARGELEPPGPPGEQAELVFRKGLEHERGYLERLRGEGRCVAEIELGDDWGCAREDTLAAMRAGVDVVYQAALTGDGWRGVADFLLRVEDRMCNFCREIATFRVLQRGGILDGEDAFDVWVADYRAAFFERFGFAVPDPVPQTNDVDDPASGTPIYEDCTATAAVLPGWTVPRTDGQGCLPPDL